MLMVWVWLTAKIGFVLLKVITPLLLVEEPVLLMVIVRLPQADVLLLWHTVTLVEPKFKAVMLKVAPDNDIEAA